MSAAMVPASVLLRRPWQILDFSTHKVKALMTLALVVKLIKWLRTGIYVKFSS